jgi:hypothetical protein
MYKYKVKARFGGHEPHEDMLRYDHAKVLGKTDDGWYIIKGEKMTIARWNSFSFDVQVMNDDEE